MDSFNVDSLLTDLYKRGKPVKTLQNFSSAFAGNDREFYVKAFENILQTEPPELLAREKDEILATLERFSRDSELKIRTYLVDNLISLCSACVTQLDHSAGSFGSALLCTVLSIALRYLSDNMRVAAGAHKTIIYLIENGFLDATIIERAVCPTVLELCHNKNPLLDTSDRHANTIGIIAKIAPIIGQQKTYDMFYDVFIKISKCTDFYVRKHCAKAFPVICEVLGTAITEEKMLPIYIRLCEDKISAIRVMCATILPQMALLVSMELRRKQLVLAMKHFIFDDSDWVIVTALKALGQFMASFAQPQIYGLAYDYRLDLAVTNAADEDFRQAAAQASSAYGSQSCVSILQNLEAYERECESRCSGLTPAQIEELRAQEAAVRVEQYLPFVATFSAPCPFDRRTSSASMGDSDDTGISVLSEDFKSSKYADFVPPYMERPKAHNVLASTDEVLKSFVALCMPLKNNFTEGPIRGYSPSKDGSEDPKWPPMSRSRVFSGDMDGDEDRPHRLMYSSANSELLPLPPPPPSSIEAPAPADDSANNNTDVGSSEEGLKLSEFFFKLLQKKPSENDSNDNVFLENAGPAPTVEGATSSDEEAEEFNSHRYWYIPPPDLDLTNSNSGANASESGGEEEEEKKRTSSCDSTIIVTSDNDEILDLLDSDSEPKKPRISDKELINPALFESGETEWSLIEDFLMMKDIDSELLYQCAYYFPAVLFTFGSRFWPLFQPHYIELCCNFKSSVRKTIAASISQVAMIIGREHATRDLVAPFLDFLSDSDEIKMGVLKTFSTFIRVIDASAHENILNRLDLCLYLAGKKANWRFRETIGLQLLKLIKMHDQINKKHCLLYFIGLSIKLMSDRYDCVRKVGVEAFIKAVRRTPHQPEVLRFFRDQFAYDVNWKRKQLYILTVDRMLATNAISAEMLHEHVLECLLNLSTHHIPNIRIYAARCLSTTILSHEYFQKDNLREMIGLRVYELNHDHDRDVRENASLAHLSEEVIELASIVGKLEKLECKDELPVDTTGDLSLDQIIESDIGLQRAMQDEAEETAEEAQEAPVESEPSEKESSEPSESRQELEMDASPSEADDI